MNLIKKLKYFVLLLCISSCAQQKAEDTVRLIPEGYEGSALIIFNQEDGEPKEYEDGKRIYRIPKNGVLKTQFGQNYGVQNHQFFYVDKEGSRTEIPFVIVQDEEALSQIKDNDKTYAYWEQALGKGEKYDPETKKLLRTIQPARSFYIGNLLDINKDYREQLNFIFKHHK